MKTTDRGAFGALLTDVLAFYKQDASTFALSVWWEACKSFDLEQVRRALTAHAMDPDRGQFPPKPADLVRQLRGTHGDRAQLAWGLVYEAMGRVGAYASVEFGDPAIHAAIVDGGGWTAMCRCEERDLPFVQKRFCDAYRVYSQRGAPNAPQTLAGDHALQLAGTKWVDRAPRPVLLGLAKEKAMGPAIAAPKGVSTEGASA